MLPNKTPNQSFELCGGGNYKTPVLNGNSIKSQSRNVTPSRNMDFRGATDGDRYIPQHNQEQFDSAKLSFNKERRLNASSSLPNSSEKDKSNIIRGKSANDLRQMNNGIEMFIFRRNNAPIVAGTKKQNVLYKCMNPSSSVRNSKRVYPKVPIYSIDAPGMATDYYYNIIDWSSNNLIAVALKDKVYTLDVQTSVSTLFKDFGSIAIEITSLKFSKDGAFLAIGLDNGYIHLFTTETQQFLRKFGSGNWRICSATWASCGLLSFGNRGGIIQTHDVRERLSFKSEIQHHEAEVCGLNWVCNEQYLVSGSADSIVNVYTRDDAVTVNPQKLYSFDGHHSTVKGIEECPFMYGNIIATSGLNDGSVKFWNLSTGEMVTSVQTDNRIFKTSSIVFDQYYREMATSHSGTKSCINIWKYSAASMDFAITHEIELTDPGLNMVKSACDQYVGIFIDPDELAFFDLFRKNERCHSEISEARRKQLSLKFSSIRQQIR